MSRPATTQRQVLYALVAAGFVLVVIILTIGAAMSGLVPAWWSVVLAASITSSSVWIGRNWRRTGAVLSIAIGLFLVWLVGTLALAG